MEIRETQTRKSLDRSARVWALAAALCGLAAAAPLWAASLLPFQDAPQHVAAVGVLAGYADPQRGFARFFVIDWLGSQYVAFYAPAALFAKWLGPQAAVRLVLTLVALALPAAAWLLLGAFRRDRRLALLAPAAFHTAPLWMGFFNFVLSVPFAIAAVALTERELQAPSRRRALLLTLLTLLLLWIHPAALAIAVGAGLFLAATAAVPRRQRLRGLLPLAPAALALVLWVLLARIRRAPGAEPGHLVWLAPRERVLDVLRFWNVLAGHADELFAVALAVLLLALWLVPAGAHRPALQRGWRLPALALGALAAALLAPFGVGYVSFIPLRALPFAALFAFASPRLAPRPLTSALLGAALAVQLAYAGVLAVRLREFDAEAQAPLLAEVLQEARPGARLFGLMSARQSRVVQFQAYLHFGLYYEVERGGRARFNFAEYPWSPVRFRPGTEPLPLRPYYEGHPEAFDPLREGAEADYVLVGDGPPPGAPFALRVREGRWSLYEARR